MNILNVEGISKVYGEKTIFQNASLGIQAHDKIGIVGRNGTGKSTLLKVIAGLEAPGEGRIVRSNHIHMTYLPQHFDGSGHATVLDYVLSQARVDITDVGEEANDTAEAGEESYTEWVNPTDAKRLLAKLGIMDTAQLLDTLSGGQKKRVALAKALLYPTDVLLLDEPTNHLDSQMIEWLEGYLQSFPGTILLVTHDRYFLDNVTNRIVELEQGHIYSYDTDYAGYLDYKCQREEMALATDDKRRNLLRNELKWVMRGAKARSTKQKARLQRFEELKNTAGVSKQERIELESMASRLGKKTIVLHDISKAYEDKPILSHFNYHFVRNDRVGIVGSNGCGKTTLLKLITGELLPDTGFIEQGETIRIGYLSQEPAFIAKDIRVIDSVKEIAEYLPTANGRISASKLCERFLFTPDMQYTLVGKLSGGELRRLYLLHVLMGAPNVLILDEPTNDLDIDTLNVLEDYLEHFEGIILVVSHDRYFLDRIVTRIFAFEPDGLQQYEGGYTDYYWKHQERYEGAEKDSQAAQKPSKGNGNGKADGASEERTSSAKTARTQHDKKLKFTYKEQREYETIDDDIAELEAKIAELEAQITSSATDFVKLTEYTSQKEALEQELEEKMERWVYLNDLAERIQKGSS